MSNLWPAESPEVCDNQPSAEAVEEVAPSSPTSAPSPSGACCRGGRGAWSGPGVSSTCSGR